MKTLVAILSAFVLAILVQLWGGKGGVARVAQLRQDLQTQLAANDQARQRNAQLQAELQDLREGLEMVEEKARQELGLIKPDEIFVQLKR
ncbi:septum formation initiator family protein [Roseateles sp. BYS180W]|uniref:Cell division protein FtsB n=1 Tax=Roseateles rivi TaxID=3299028 RepID=A0ABW7FVK8_9BURK